MYVKLLHPTDVKIAKDTIIENISANPVFVAPADCELFEYIPKLELKEKIQSRMLLCKEMKIDVLLNYNGKSEKYSLLSELIKNINPDEHSEVVVLGDANTTDDAKIMEVRYSLCAIIQQFIYLNIQLSNVSICTEKEAIDNEKIRAFENAIEKHKRAVDKSISLVNALIEDNTGHKKEILSKLENIKKYIESTQDNELKIAVAATKKSGKSVIVNSMIECEIAPTSLELATPNNCIYRKSDDENYSLEYKKESYTNSDPEKIRSILYGLFTNAGKDYNAISDMNLRYPSNKNGFSSYTIYDTPGPNLANAKTHREAASRGVNAADVIIFTIDYSKYLTDDEYKYIKEVWQMCQKKGKKYSLILNVNKLDLRYDDNCDKSVVRIVDFIRNRLISTGKKDGIDFRGCVVIGTSALTYFNAHTASKLICPNSDGNCSILEEDFSDKALKKLILSYDDSDKISPEYEKRAISTLQQLRGMLDNAYIWHKLEIESSQEMETFSGMPNLLSYVDYIATQKARSEKVNNLIFRIDSEYKSIMNLFHIEELLQRLKENKELLEKALNILRDFNQEVETILDKDYKDLYQDKYNEIYNLSQEMHSVYLLKLTQKIPIIISEIGELYSRETDEQLGFETVLNEVTTHRIPTSLDRELRQKYSNYKESSNLQIESICKDYTRILSNICKNEMIKYVTNRKNELGKKLKEEQEAVRAVFMYLWSNRLAKLREVVQTYSAELVKNCSEQLNVEIPEFQLVLGKHQSGNKLNLTISNENGLHDIIEKAMRESNTFKEGNMGGIVGWIRKILGAENKITFENVLSIYDKKQFAIDLQGVYKKSGNLESYLKSEVREPMKSDMNDFLENMKEEISSLNKNIISVVQSIEKSIDESDKYKKTVAEIEREKELIIELKKAVEPFSTTWNEVTKC